MPRPGEDLLFVEELLWMLVSPTGQSIYDFPFDRFFACRRPYQPPERLVAGARAGAWEHQSAGCRGLVGGGIPLDQPPLPHRLALQRPPMDPLLGDPTPARPWVDASPG